MSSATAVQYTVAQVAAMREAADLARELSRLRVAEQERLDLDADCAAFAATYGETIAVAPVPTPVDVEDSARLRVCVDLIEERTADARRRLVTARARQQRERLRERLRSLDAPGPGGATVTRAPREAGRAGDPGSGQGTAERRPAEVVEASVAALDEGVELSEEFLRLAQALAQAPRRTERDAMATRALQDEVARLNRAGRDHRRALEALRELDVRLGAVGGDGPGVAGARAALTVAVDRARAGRPVDLVALTEAVGEVEDAARRAVEREYVERTLTEILGALGYEVVDGFEKVVPNGGRLVRKPGWSHHGVMVEVDGEEITLDVVRTATEEATATAKLRDEEIEEAFCGDVPGVLEELAAAGIGSASVHRIPPGIVAVREVEGARKVQTRTASARRRKPQERKL